MHELPSAASRPAHPGAPDLLQVRDLASAFAGPFSFTVAAGECLVVRGPSGAGKSLLLRLIADLDPGSGEVLLDGVARSTISAPHWRSRVVYQSAEPAWWEATAAAHFRPGQEALAQALLAQVGLGRQQFERDISLLSTGERQRLALVRSLAGEPAALLLDEPTAALDQVSTLMVEKLLRAQLAGGLALVLVTHSDEQAARLGNRELFVIPRTTAPAP